MPHYVVTYAPWTHRRSDLVEADGLRREGPWTVLEVSRLVVGQERRVVALRVATAELAAHDPIEGPRPSPRRRPDGVQGHSTEDV